MKITSKIGQHDCMIPGSTTNNMQCSIQMCLKEDNGHFQHVIYHFVQHETQYVSYQHYHILFIRSWSTAKYLGFIHYKSPRSSPHISSYLRFSQVNFYGQKFHIKVLTVGPAQTHTHTHNDPKHTLSANGSPAVCISSFYPTSSYTPFICEYYISVELQQCFWSLQVKQSTKQYNYSIRITPLCCINWELYQVMSCVPISNIILWITIRFSTSASASASEEDSPWAGAIRRDSTPSFSARRRSLSAFLCCSSYSKTYILIYFSKQSRFYWSKFLKLYVSGYTLLRTWSKQSRIRLCSIKYAEHRHSSIQNLTHKNWMDRTIFKTSA